MYYGIYRKLMNKPCVNNLNLCKLFLLYSKKYYITIYI